ncbi:MAG: EscU/YscU/HrcU family type III secretion system export apparatus switch protein [Candidatus Tumulicola sp.]
MSDEAEKPFEPTPQRLQKAKREGNVARSVELPANVAFLVAAIALASLVLPIGTRLGAALARAASSEIAPWDDAVLTMAAVLVPMGAAAAAGIAAAIVQSGGVAVVPLRFAAERLDVFAGIRRIASRETMAHAVRAIAAFCVAASAISSIVVHAGAQLLRAHDPAELAATAWQGVRGAALTACACGLAFAVAEYASARRAWLLKLRMSFDERKREAKEQDGDPNARGRRRALHRSFLRGAPSDVKDASFVVVNPTHVAVALQYAPPRVQVPVILVAAAGQAALRVRSLAAELRVPIVENPPLARALFADAAIGRPIALEHYVAVAEVVAALSRASSEART